MPLDVFEPLFGLMRTRCAHIRTDLRYLSFSEFEDRRGTPSGLISAESSPGPITTAFQLSEI